LNLNKENDNETVSGFGGDCAGATDKFLKILNKTHNL